MPLAPFQDMTLFDGLIIYFALAAPFAVYHFLHSRKISKENMWLETFLNFFFWPPLAARLVIRASFKPFPGNAPANVNDSDAETEERVHLIYRTIRADLQTSAYSLSVLEFREVFDRYVGLTMLAKKESTEANRELHELFTIDDNSNPDLAATCLNRRNRNRIRRHQSKARIDFLAFVAEHAGTGLKKYSIAAHAIELAELLGDALVTNELRAEVTRRGVITDNVLDAEKEVWIAETPKPSGAGHVSAT